MKTKKIIAASFIIIMMLCCISVTAFANSNNTSIETRNVTDQNNNFIKLSDTQSSGTTINVKISWIISNIEVSYKSTNRWNPDEMKWEETKVINSVSSTPASFVIENCSDTAYVITNVSFDVDDELAATYDADNSTFTNNDCITSPSSEQTITASLAFNNENFSTISVPNTISTYGIYTVSISKFIPVTSIVITNEDGIGVDFAIEDVGGTLQLVATVYPEDATNKNLIWSSGDDSQYTVDQNGLVTRITDDNDSMVDITATAQDGCGASSSITASACFAAGTKITMADGTTKNIEDITEGEYVLTFNHENGKYESQKVYLAYTGTYALKAFTLHFDNGNSISIIGAHDLFEKESLSYVGITKSNASKYIGKYFYSVEDNKYLELTSITYETEAVDFYSLYTEYNANCIANGMISVPNDIDEFLKIYQFNEDLTINKEQLQADIEEYGLYEFNPETDVSIELYNTQRWKYVNIVVGKGLNSIDNLFTKRDAFLADNNIN